MSGLPRKNADLSYDIVTGATDSTLKSEHENAALDEALMESFPASDPVAVSITRIDSNG